MYALLLLLPACTAGKFWHPSHQCYYSSAGFSAFVVRGQLVEADQRVTHVFQPSRQGQRVSHHTQAGAGA